MTYSCDSDDGFKEPYYDFDSELSVGGGGGGGARRARVGFCDGSAKPRPKSACSVRSKREKQAAPTRCHSALGLRHGRGESHPEIVLTPSSDDIPGDKTCIRNFRRSLKLLGLQLEGFDLDAGEPSPKPDVKNAKSKVGSLVTRRSVSLEDLHEAVVRVGFPLTPDIENLKHRKVLAKAIYEEWYFKKQEEEEKKKAEARQQQKVKQWELQHRRCEQMRKSQECFKEWLHKKRKQQQEQYRNSVKGPVKPTYSSNPVTSQRAQSAYESWRKEKEKQIKKQQEEARQRQKMLEENTNREDSEKAYKEWKKKADKEWFARMKKIENKVKELEKEEERKMIEKKKCAELAYKGWLETKEKELKKRLRDARRAHLEAQKQRAKRHSDRLYESQQAFLAWLDVVEKRFCEELLKKQSENHLAAGD